MAFRGKLVSGQLRIERRHQITTALVIGYYNVMAKSGFHGHIRYERCAAIAFVERPFMGRSSAFVSFFNQEGGIMYKVFVGRDENRELKGDQLTAFRALAQRFCEKG